jgi:hypothetical protein
MKKSILVEEYDHKTGQSEGCFSKITLKRKGKGVDEKRIIKLKNHGGTWVNKYETRAKAVIYDQNNTKNKPEVTITLQSGNVLEMSFLDLCNIKDLVAHERELGANMFGATRKIGEQD